MYKKCNHYYWEPMKSLMMCYKCGHKIHTYKMDHISIDELKNLYPFTGTKDSILFNKSKK